MQKRKAPLPGRAQPLTLRIPESEYQLLRTLAYANQATINEVVLHAIRRMLDQDKLREKLQAIIDHALYMTGEPPPSSTRRKATRRTTDTGEDG